MKKLGIIVGLVTVACLAVYLLFAQPKLEANLLATGIDNKTVVITLGNAGIQEILLLDVLINNSDTPKNAKIQMKTSDQGFVLSESSADDKGYRFVNYNKINIEPGTSEKDVAYDSIYGLTIEDDKKINLVTIRYKYIGKEFKETVTVN